MKSIIFFDKEDEKKEIIRKLLGIKTISQQYWEDEDKEDTL